MLKSEATGKGLTDQKCLSYSPPSIDGDQICLMTAIQAHQCFLFFLTTDQLQHIPSLFGGERNKNHVHRRINHMDKISQMNPTVNMEKSGRR